MTELSRRTGPVTLLVRDEGPHPATSQGSSSSVQLAQDGVKVRALHPRTSSSRKTTRLHPTRRKDSARPIVRFSPVSRPCRRAAATWWRASCSARTGDSYSPGRSTTASRAGGNPEIGHGPHARMRPTSYRTTSGASVLSASRAALLDPLRHKVREVGTTTASTVSPPAGGAWTTVGRPGRVPMAGRCARRAAGRRRRRSA